MLEIEGIDVSYGKVQVLYDVSFSVAQGEIVALLGTNGAGKSTLLKAISGILPVGKGRITFEGRSLVGLASEEIVKAGIVQVPGGRGTFPGLTVAENLRMGGYIYRRDKATWRREVDRVMEYFPWIAERGEQLAGTLSGGQQQQLLLARAFVARPRVLLIDELSLGLAPIVVQDLLDVVRHINEQGCTVVIVEQHVNLALSFAGRAYFLEKGEVRFEGASADLLGREDLLRSVFLAGAQKAPMVSGVAES
ncbi:MAG: ABC transporter ATP-binding protein [Actinomycetota bacterium]